MISIKTSRDMQINMSAIAGLLHLVYIIGYDDTQQCWIVKNSWGTDWGETASFTPYTPGGGDGGYFRPM